MSDLRFKIIGDSSPFKTDVCVLGSNTVVASKVFEYSGITTNDNHTCAIIGGLSENTQYTVGITDSIGNVFSFVSDATPPNPIVIPIELNVDLRGSYSSPTNDAVFLSGDKNLTFTPALFGTQRVTVTLSGGSSYSTSDDYSEVVIYCKPNGGSTYTKIDRIINNTNQISFDVIEGDSVCYTMQSSISYSNAVQEYSFANSALCLISVEPITGFGSSCILTCGPQTLLNINKSCNITTTTTTTTAPPISVFFNNVTTDISLSSHSKTATLSTVPLLAAGQSVRVCFYSKDYYSFESFLPRPMHIDARATWGAVLRSSVSLTSVTSGGPVSDTADGSFYFDVNRDNINDLLFKVNILDHVTNSDSTHLAYSCMCVCGITNMVGGIYSSDKNADIIVTRLDIQSDGTSGDGDIIEFPR